MAYRLVGSRILLSGMLIYYSVVDPTSLCILYITIVYAKNGTRQYTAILIFFYVSSILGENAKYQSERQI